MINVKKMQIFSIWISWKNAKKTKNTQTYIKKTDYVNFILTYTDSKDVHTHTHTHTHTHYTHNIIPIHLHIYKHYHHDHWIVTAKIRLSLWSNVTQTTTTVHYDLSLLNNRDIRDKYMVTQRNKFNALQEMSETPTANDKYENFINAHSETAAECILTK